MFANGNVLIYATFFLFYKQNAFAPEMGKINKKFGPPILQQYSQKIMEKTTNLPAQIAMIYKILVIFCHEEV